MTDGFEPRRRDAARALERAAADRRSELYVLRLFITGLLPRSSLAVERIKHICERHLPGRYDLAVIDLFQQPHLARWAQVVVAPTLVRLSPEPRRLLVGDLGDEERVLRALDLPPAPIPERGR